MLMIDIVGMKLEDAILELEYKNILYRVNWTCSGKAMAENTIDIVVRQKWLDENTVLVTANRIKTII